MTLTLGFHSMKTAVETRLALLTALQEIAKGVLAASSNAERNAFVLAMTHTEAALAALE